MERDLSEPLPGFDSIESALADMAAGKFVVVLDDEDRENEGDLIIAADRVSTSAMHFLVEHSSGVVCCAMTGEDLKRLKLPQMVSSSENEEALYTAFAITTDLKEGTTTGISAADRAKTIRHMADPSSRPEEFRRPGHIFPLRARPGGVLIRPGHTEASVDLARLAGCYPAGVLCELVNRKDGSMARTADLQAFAKTYGLKVITIADLARYRLKHDPLVKLTASGPMSSKYGPMTVHSFESILDGTEHLVFVAGHKQRQQARNAASNGSGSAGQDGASGSGSEGQQTWIHQERLVADLMGVVAEPSSSSTSLDGMLARIGSTGAGVVVHLRSPARRGMLACELSSVAQAVPDSESCSVSSMDMGPGERGWCEAGIVEYAMAAQMLRKLGVTACAVAGGDSRAAKALRSCGLKVSSLGAAADGHPPPATAAAAAAARNGGAAKLSGVAS